MKTKQNIFLAVFLFSCAISIAQKSDYKTILIPSENKKGKYGYVNPKGKKIIPFMYEKAFSFIEEFAVVKQNGKYFYINKENKPLTKDSFDLSWPFHNGLALVMNNNKYAYVDKAGKIVQNYWFDYASLIFDNYAEATLDGVNYLITPAGQVMNYGNNKIPRLQTELYMIVQEMPVFPGGVEQRQKFIVQNIRIPNIEDFIVKIVNLSFNVEQDGRITNVTVERSGNEIFDNEAIRLVQSMPPWIPGKKNGVPVRVKQILPIEFRKK